MSSTVPYRYYLGANQYEGEINGIRIIWGNTAKGRLTNDAKKLGVPIQTLKILTENFTYLCAARLGCQQVNILGAPHTFTTDSSTKSWKEDLDHISCQFSNARPDGQARKGRYKVHVYLANIGVGRTAYDAVAVAGERVVQKNKGPDTLRPDLCKGEYPELDAR